jgi:hypothetical protein
MLGVYDVGAAFMTFQRMEAAFMRYRPVLEKRV